MAIVRCSGEQFGLLATPRHSLPCLAGSICLIFCFLLVSCAERSGPAVRFVVPDGFRGPVQILETGGGRSIVLEGSEYVYRIPSNGILQVAKAVGFAEWHAEHASFSSGEPLRVGQTSDPEEFAGEVVFYSLGSTHTRFRFFVGTHSEMVKYVRNAPPESEAARFWAGQSRTNVP